MPLDPSIIDALCAGLAMMMSVLSAQWTLSGGWSRCGRHWPCRGHWNRPTWPPFAFAALALYCTVEALFWRQMEAAVAGWLR